VFWNRKPPPLLIDFVYFIKAQAKKKISPAGVALSMVPILGTSSLQYISFCQRVKLGE